jgi:NAD-dependent deacetylase sirtuin 4
LPDLEAMAAKAMAAKAMAATASSTSFHLSARANLGFRRLKTSTSAAEASPSSKLTQVLATASRAGYGRRRPSTVPDCEPATAEEIASLASFIGSKERLLVITGAGCSTESNIPDYRSPTGAYSSGFKPMTHQDFLKTEANQRRYWARSFVGWRRFAEQTAPNDAHRAIAELQRESNVWRLITQNVDRLHQVAGAADVLELHGSTHDVQCLACGAVSCRRRLQRRLADLNPRLAAAADAAIDPRSGEAPYDDGATPSGGLDSGTPNLRTRPDGDVELDGELVVDFVVPPCETCNRGPLKPAVVFFGDGVPAATAEEARAMSDGCDGVLIVGSSVSTFSAFRLVRDAHMRGVPVAVLTCGWTRVDEMASVKVEKLAGEVLPRVVERLRREELWGF